jgi:hypothetical protein
MHKIGALMHQNKKFLVRKKVSILGCGKNTESGVFIRFQGSFFSFLLHNFWDLVKWILALIVDCVCVRKISNEFESIKTI